MLNSIQSLLDVFPEGAVHLREGQVLAANRMALRYLPGLTPGGSLPACILLPEEGEEGAGFFTAGPACYTYSCGPGGEDRVILFRPAPQSALTGRQLEGALQQLRALLGEILAEAGPASLPGGEFPVAAFSKSFHRLFRLTGNLEFMQRAAGEEGVPFHPVTMDLAGLCRRTVRLAGDLLKESGVCLEYTSSLSGLLIPGDPELLQKLLLSLISNAAREAGQGRVGLSLSRQRDQARMIVSTGGGRPEARQLTALFQQGTGDGLPLPGQGAGLGLSIARHIVTLHTGTLLTQWGDSGLSTAVALPTGPLDGYVSVRTPMAQQDGGLDPVLTELADLLPAGLFGWEGLD